MKTITLEEAYAKASKRPIRARFSPEPHILTKGRGSSVAWCINQQDLRGECDAALLAHAFNVLPEVVEALESACLAAADCLPPSGKAEIDPLYYKAKLLAIDKAAAACSSALAKAGKVVLP